MTEQQLQTKIIKYLQLQGAYVVNGLFTRKGIPDLVFCYYGIFAAIEVKLPITKHKVSPLQQHHIDEINDAGGHAIVAWELSQVKEFLEELDELRAKNAL